MSDQKKRPGVEAFTFGEPEPVLNGRGLLDYSFSYWSGQWYEPPMSLLGLDKVFRAAVHHASAIRLQVNILKSTFIPHPWLSRSDFHRMALDYRVFGNAYLEPIMSRGGRISRLKPAPALYTRKARDGAFWWVPNWMDKNEFDTELVHLMEPDTAQEIYGVPEYLAGLQSILLNESATLFRRRYYENGSHAGFILYINDAAQESGDIDAIRNALKESKGVGNFKNLFLYSPNGKKDGIQVIPISEVMAKDEFLNIKNVTRDDQLAIHRMPPQLMGVIPQQGAAFGDARTAAVVWAANEATPLQTSFQDLNDQIGEEVFSFKPYTLDLPDAATA